MNQLSNLCNYKSENLSIVDRDRHFLNLDSWIKLQSIES